MRETYDIDFFRGIIKNVDFYYAHLPKEGDNRQPETLAEHSSLVVHYAKELCRVHNLSPVISQMIEHTVPIDFEQRSLIVEIVHELFWRSIAFHDFGKVNHKFQTLRMKHSTVDMLRVEHDFEHQHSIISVYIFLAFYFKRLMQCEFSNEHNEMEFVSNIALYLSYPMYKHHASTLDECQRNDNWDREDLFSLRPYLQLFDGGVDDDLIENYHGFLLANANFNCLFEIFNSETVCTSDRFSLYALTRLNYSLLTASDYLATAHYMNGWKELIGDYGVIDDGLRSKIVNSAQSSKAYNKVAFENVDNGYVLPNLPTERNNVNLNVLRTNLASEVIRNVRNNIDKRLFYIEAPTGAGKTNVSMLALSELLNNDRSLQKVFYVFPFTTLITQTHSAIKETLGLEEGEVAEIHSKSSLVIDNDCDNLYLNFLDSMLMNYPVTMLSHVKFFDILKTNHKETNYLLHRLANSVVIIDELQSYSPQIWDKMIYFVVNYAKYFNMKFILMSATLPKIGKLTTPEMDSKFVYLVNNKNSYFQNPNFCSRVKFDYSLLDWKRPNKDEVEGYLARLAHVVTEKSQDYANRNSLHPNSVFSIVEFIFKNTADKFYSLVKEQIDFFDVVFLLSGTILEARRQEIIKALKSEEYRGKKVLLVTTQVVEAGVDIDMDLGFKDKSLIDSEEQLAGRINRNVNKNDCILYVFDCNTEKTLYGGDDRFKTMREMGMEVYKEIIGQKDFDKLYDIIIEHIGNRNKSVYTQNIKDVQEAVATLNYAGVNKMFRIIDSSSQSVFIPLSINVSMLGENMIESANLLGIRHEHTIDGQDVWKAYEDIINSQVDFVQTKIKLKLIQGLMSCFTISMFPNGKSYNLLKTYGEERHGFLYLESYKDVYSFDNGINTSTIEAESVFL